jgi:hypothetical protein
MNQALYANMNNKIKMKKKKNSTQKRAGGMAQGVGPDSNPSTTKKKKERKKEKENENTSHILACISTYYVLLYIFRKYIQLREDISRIHKEVLNSQKQHKEPN